MNNRGKTSGVVYVHSSPSAVCPHVEWAISGTLGVRADALVRPLSASLKRDGGTMVSSKRAGGTMV